MIDIDKLMKEKLEKVKKGYQSCKKALCESCPYDYMKRPDDHYCDSSEMSDDAMKVIEYLEKKVEDQQERIDIMAADMPEWHFFNIRPMTDEEKEYFDRVDDENAEMIENCPEDGEEVILYTPFGMSIDTFHSEIEFVCFDNHPDIEKGWAWMPVPKPPNGDDDNADTSD